VTTRAEQEPQVEDATVQAEWEAAQKRAPLIQVYGVYDNGYHELLGEGPWQMGTGL